MVRSFTEAEELEWLNYSKTPEGENLVVDKPEVKNEWGHYGDYELVGHGERTSPKCGSFLKIVGCVRGELHDTSTLDGHNHAGEGFFKKVFWHCDKPDCPICYKRGWSVREARAIEERLKEASKRFGQVEHVIVSIPQSDYGLKFEDMRKKVIGALGARMVFGGVLIFHAFRYATHAVSLRKGVKKGWYWNPHFHCLGYVTGGYGRCRHCKKSVSECMSCSGFEGLTRRAYFEEGGKRTRGEFVGTYDSHGSGYIVKVAGERKTVNGTAWYQLNHSSFRRGGKRHTVAFWFGTCSYRKLKLKPKDVRERAVCPLCGHELEDVFFVGEPKTNPLSSERFWVRECWDKLEDSGGCRWMVKPER